MHASSASQPEAQETDKKRRVAAQGAARRTRVRGCSPCQQYPDAQLPSLRSEASPPGSCAQLDAAWTPAPHRFPSGPGALSATYWGSAWAARWGRGPGRGPASERLQRAGDPTREKARGAATTFQVRADRSSRRRAAQGGLGTWAPHWVGAGRRGEGRGRRGRPAPPSCSRPPPGALVAAARQSSRKAVSGSAPLYGPGQGARTRGSELASLGGRGSKRQGLAVGKMPPFLGRTQSQGRFWRFL